VIRPSAVDGPVATASIVAVPLITDVPIRTTDGEAVASGPGVAPANLPTGNGSPVSSDWSTYRCRDSTRRPSAGTIEPASSRARSPGTICATGTRRSTPSLTTRAWRSTERRNRSAA
jgi:hypothetical protein